MNLLKKCRSEKIFFLFSLALILIGALVTVMILTKKESWLTVEVRVARPEWWIDIRTPYWLGDAVAVGDKQVDTLGRTMAEVTRVDGYSLDDERRMVLLRLKMKVGVNKRSGNYSFDHRSLVIGGPVELSFLGKTVTGYVRSIEGVVDQRPYQEMVVEARLTNISSAFPETLGVFPWRAEAVRPGDKMVSMDGRVLAEVLEVKTNLAEKTIITDSGKTYLGTDPMLRDVYLTLKLSVTNYDGENYFLDDIKVKVGNSLFLALPEADIRPEVVGIVG